MYDCKIESSYTLRTIWYAVRSSNEIRYDLLFN